MAYPDAWFGEQCKIGFAKKNTYPATPYNDTFVEGMVTNFKISGGGISKESIPMFGGAFKGYTKPQEDFEISVEGIFTDTYFSEVLMGGEGFFIDTFDSYATNGALTTAWANTGDGSTPTLDTTNVKGGRQGAKLAWTFSGGTATYTADLSTNHGTTYNISGFTGASGAPTRGRIEFWCYVPNATVLSHLATNGVEIRLGSSSGNYKGWYFLKAALSVGWNRCAINMATTPDTTAGTADWTAVDYAAIVVHEGTTDSTGITIDELRVSDPQITTVQQPGDWRVTFLQQTSTSATSGAKLRYVFKNAKAITFEPENDSKDYLKGTLTFKVSPTDSSGAANVICESTPDASKAALTTLSNW